MDWRRDRDWDRSSTGRWTDPSSGWKEDEDRYGREFRHGSNAGDENRRWQGGDDRRWRGADENRRWQGGDRGSWGLNEQGHGRGAYGGEGWGRDRWEGRDWWEGRRMEDRDRNPPQQQHLNRFDWRGNPWHGRGQYAGKGPRGYRRSDDRIREDICDALTRDPDVDATEVVVAVEGGVVTLTGSVDDRRQKRMAENCAEWIEGVHDVHNQLRVQGRDDLGRTDELRAEVKSGRNLPPGQSAGSGDRTTGSERSA